MVQFIDRQPTSFGEKAMRGLGMAAQSIPEILGDYHEQKQKEKKQKMIMDLLSPNQRGPLGGIEPADQEKEDERFRDLALEVEQASGQDLNPQDLDQLYGLMGRGREQRAQPQLEITPEKILQMQQLDPDIAKNLMDIYKLQQHQEEFKQNQVQDLYKATGDYRKAVAEGAQGARTSNIILDKMVKLNKGDKLADPLVVKFGELFGIPLSKLANPESEEFEKLSNNLTREVSQIFRGRILASEFENFLKQIPTLLNSKEGRARIIKSMQLINAPRIQEQKIAQKIIQRNKGVPPINLQDLVAEEMEPFMDKLAEEFKQEYVPPEPEESLLDIFGE